MKHLPKKSLVDLESDQVLRYKWLDNFTEDAVRIVGNRAIAVGNTLVDTVGGDIAHRDGFQLIPPQIFPRSQFAGAIQEKVQIWGNHIRSRGKLQCVFSSDGFQTDLEVVDNVMETHGQWFSAIRGLLSGCFSGNINSEGKPAPIWLGNGRIGGGENVLIVSFRDHEYMPYQDFIDWEDWDSVTDVRGQIENPCFRHVANFDLLGFHQAAAEIVVPETVSGKEQALWHANAMADLACCGEFGELVHPA